MITQAEIIEVLKMQSILNGSICLLIALIGLAGLLGAYTIIRNGLQVDDADSKRWMTSLGITLGIISLVGFCVFFWMGLTRVANPGMAAIDFIVRTAQGKLF
jgi:hypothetical protein